MMEHKPINYTEDISQLNQLLPEEGSPPRSPLSPQKNLKFSCNIDKEIISKTVVIDVRVIISNIMDINHSIICFG